MIRENNPFAMSLPFEELSQMVMRQAKEKNFGVQPEEINVGEKIALIHAELSEALEAYRRDDMAGPHGFDRELGDALGRLIHLAGIFDIDLEKQLLEKIKVNEDRDWGWDRLTRVRE